MTKKKQVKSKSEVENAEAEGRMAAFNRELAAIAKKYQVRLDVSQRVVIVDAKSQKTSK